MSLLYWPSNMGNCNLASKSWLTLRSSISYWIWVNLISIYLSFSLSLLIVILIIVSFSSYPGIKTLSKEFSFFSSIGSKFWFWRFMLFAECEEDIWRIDIQKSFKLFYQIKIRVNVIYCFWKKHYLNRVINWKIYSSKYLIYGYN